MKITAITVAALSAAGAASASFTSYQFVNDVADINADIVLSFDDLTVGQVLNTGDVIAPGVTFGVAGRSNVTALVVDQGNGDLALQMIQGNPSAQTNPSAIGFTLDAAFEGVFASWERTSGLNNFDGGFGNPAVQLFDVNDSIVDARSSGWGPSLPGTQTDFARGVKLVQGTGDAEAFGVMFDISASGSNSIWTIDDVIIQVPTPGSAVLASVAGLAAIRRRR